MSAGTTYPALIGTIIKCIREDRAITQGEMAKSMGISQAAWSKLESGKSTLSTSQLAKVADILVVPAHKIIEHAEQAKTSAQDKGMTVTYDNKEAQNTGLMLLGAAALMLIVGAILRAKK